MAALTMRRIAALLAAAAIATTLAAAPRSGMAMGGGRGGSNDIGFQGVGARGGGEQARAPGEGAHGIGPIAGARARGPLSLHDSVRPHRAGDYFQDDRAPGAPSQDDPVIYGGAIPGGGRINDSAFADHRLMGPVFDEVRRDWPVVLPFGPQMYGARDFPHCMRRDVYGDPYQAC